jgi:hypothetical protein
MCSNLEEEIGKMRFLITTNDTLQKKNKKRLPSIVYSMNFVHNKHIVQQCFCTPTHTYFTKELV